MWRNKGIIAVVLAVLCLAGCTAKHSDSTIPAAPKVETTNYKLATVQSGTFRKTEKSVGNPVYSSIESLVCEYDDALLKESFPAILGDSVKKGDVVATIVQQTSETELARLELEYERAVENMENGIARYYSQIAAISGDDSIAYMRRVQAENSLALYKMSAEKTCQEALEALEEYKQRYEEKYLLAPMDGKIYWTQAVAADSSIPKGSTVIQVFDDTKFLIRIASPSDSFLRMASPGTPVTVTFMNQSYAGTVVSTPNGIRDVSGTSVYVASEELQTIPEVGSVSVEYVQLEIENALMVDKAAIRSDDTADYVMVLEDGEALKRYVICGPEDDEVVCILDGLEAGQQVVLN